MGVRGQGLLEAQEGRGWIMKDGMDPSRRRDNFGKIEKKEAAAA